MMPKPEPILAEQLKGYTLILASGSPRRKMLLEQMNIPFTVQEVDVEEVFPPDLNGPDIPEYLARLKAGAAMGRLGEKDILLTADTIVWHEQQLLGKPADKSDAKAMLRRLSGGWHEVITAVCTTTTAKQLCATETTRVKFRELKEAELNYYVDTYRPFDKAGAYGIQEWIGLVGIEEIQGSYLNVVGLPTHRVCELLSAMVR
jgi:septum formation protein